MERTSGWGYIRVSYLTTLIILFKSDEVNSIAITLRLSLLWVDLTAYESVIHWVGR